MSVAGVAGNPYVESPLMANGMDVLGGYEPTFALARNLDPATNDTVIELTNANGVRWPAAVAATLDGFTLRMIDTSLGFGSRVMASANGSASVTLIDILTIDALTGAPPNNGAGVLIGAGNGGSLTITDSTISAPSATNAGAGISTQGGFDGPVTVTNSAISAAAGNMTYGISHGGSGMLVVTGQSVAGGNGVTAASGVSAGYGDPGTNVTLTSVTVTGGPARDARGVDVTNTGEVFIDTCKITGGGVSGGTSAIGVRADNVRDTQILETTIVGSLLASPGTLAAATGVALTTGPGSTGTASVTTSDITGGELATARVGLSTLSVSLILTLSDVAGSRTAGGASARGVVVSGFASGSHLIDGNLSIIGGQPATDPIASTPYSGIGVDVGSSTATTISNNALIQGCSPSCDGPGAAANVLGVGIGIRITAGVGHGINGNTTILGGPHGGSDPSLTAHGGIWAAPGNLGPVIGQVGFAAGANAQIAGNVDGTKRPESAVGIYGRTVDCVIDANTEISGSYSTVTAGGILIAPPLLGSNICDITDNWIGGGAGTTTFGVSVESTQLSLRRNLIDACGLVSSNPGIPADCLPTLLTYGLISTTNPIADHVNNYIFGGFGAFATACEVVPPAVGGSGAADVLTAYNLCLAQGKASTTGFTSAVGLRMFAFTGARDQYRFVDNIFGAGDQAVSRYGVEEGDSFTSARVTFIHNDFIPDTTADAMVAYYLVNAPSTELDTVTAVNGLNSLPSRLYAMNIGLDPLFLLVADPFAPAAADYHLDATCALGDTGTPVTTVGSDWDGDQRDPGTPTTPPAPEPGPDECP